MTVTLSSKVGLLTSPLQGPLDLNNKPVYQTQYSNGNSGATAVIDFTANGSSQSITLTNNCTFTFTAPPGACHVSFLFQQDPTGGHSVTWPATVLWQSGTQPVWTTGANDVNIAFFYYDGARYNGSGLVDVS